MIAQSKNTSSPHSHSHSVLILPRCTLELDGVFSAQEHLGYKHIFQTLLFKKKKKLYKLARDFFLLCFLSNENGK